MPATEQLVPPFFCPKCNKQHISTQPNDKAARHYQRVQSGFYKKYELGVTEEVEAVITPSKPIKEANIKVKVTQTRSEVIYKEDPFEVTKDGHYIDLTEPDVEKRFVVPRDFNEFYERNPNYIRRWVMKKLSKTMVDDDIMDWEADLAIHMRTLPENSIYRQPMPNRPNGCTDRIELFDPIRMHGATPARFFNFVNRVLFNFFLTSRGKNKKNPLLHANNLSYGSMEEESGHADDEYIHAHSRQLMRATDRQEKSRYDEVFIDEFYKFVNAKDPVVVPVLNAIKDTRTHNEARAVLGVDKPTYNRHRKRIKQLTQAFLTNTQVGKQRRPYQRHKQKAEPQALDTGLACSSVMLATV